MHLLTHITCISKEISGGTQLRIFNDPQKIVARDIADKVPSQKDKGVITSCKGLGNRERVQRREKQEG